MRAMQYFNMSRQSIEYILPLASIGCYIFLRCQNDGIIFMKFAINFGKLPECITSIELWMRVYVCRKSGIRVLNLNLIIINTFMLLSRSANSVNIFAAPKRERKSFINLDMTECSRMHPDGQAGTQYV